MTLVLSFAKILPVLITHARGTWDALSFFAVLLSTDSVESPSAPSSWIFDPQKSLEQVFLGCEPESVGGIFGIAIDPRL